jgi:hypothetical protein
LPSKHFRDSVRTVAKPQNCLNIFCDPWDNSLQLAGYAVILHGLFLSPVPATQRFVDFFGVYVELSVRLCSLLDKLLTMALLVGLMLGCASLPLHEAVLPDTAPCNVAPRKDNAVPSISSADAPSSPDDRGATHALPASPGMPAASPLPQLQPDSNFQLADYRSTGDCQQYPALLAGTMFDGAGSSAPYGGITASYSVAVPCYQCALPAFGGAAMSNPAVHMLPQVDDQVQISDPSLPGAINDQHGYVADGTNNTPPKNNMDPPSFLSLQDRPLLLNLLNDERNFYRCGSLEWLAVGLGGSALLANTNLDQEFRQAVHGPAGAGSTNLYWMTDMGNGEYVIPGLVAIWLLDYGIDSLSSDGGYAGTVWLQEWSGRSMRGMAVGAVPVLALQYLIGSARPGETSNGSHWTPFQSSHGVSGNAWVCAVPFWTAAQMTDCAPLQVGFYAMGSLGGIARIHTDAHYLSQVVMGWWLAGLSVSAVNHTELEKQNWYITPTVDDDGTGIALIHLW